MLTPQYSYLSLGCSKRAEQAMLNYAKSLVGKPFSNIGMARSILFPRQTDDASFFCAGKLFNRPQTPCTPPTRQGNLDQTTSCRVFLLVFFILLTFIAPVCLCAELVAAVLKRGGLMSPNSNPGAATPQSLHRLYKNQAAATANPYTLRQFNTSGAKDTEKHNLLGFQGILDQQPNTVASRAPSMSRKRGDSPPRASFRCVSVNSTSMGR